ncbi:DUF1294 domain-containing protein [Pontibacillus yanchengensis]|nr:DUF1294 domain-containing protein [Pontibacillus yanchengensis]
MITWMILIYAIIVSGIGFILMGVDKKRARSNHWRIQESTFWKVAWLGGATGNWLGMSVFRHKTKHKSFVIGTPAIIIVHLVLFIVIKARLLS